MTSTTRKSSSARLTVLEESVAGLVSSQEQILALLQGSTTKPAPKASKSRKSGSRKSTPAAPVKAVESPKVRHLVKKNRQAFVKAHPWAQGLSTSAIATAVVTGQQSCVEGWAIGPRRTEMVQAATPAPKPARKARKGGKKGSRKQQVAQVQADAPAKATDGPRNAKGHITPRSEWAKREALAMTGQFDRYEIDALVAKGV